MKVVQGNPFLALIVVLLFSTMAFSQATTVGTITGRAEDVSGALIPGVEVTVGSPAMIQGSRTAITNETGSYRFTQLPHGEYTVSFSLPGFATLNIEGISLLVGATATVAVNFSDKEFEDIPYSRSLRGIIMMIPGVFSQRVDVGFF